MRRYGSWSLLATLAIIAGLALGGGAASAAARAPSDAGSHASTRQLAQAVGVHSALPVVVRTELDRLESMLATGASASARLIPLLCALLCALALRAGCRPTALAFARASPGLARARQGVGLRAPPRSCAPASGPLS